ncbi:hypothetical protein PL11201_310006 [Planktothrix sp. PCC 11201]|nr:hypothetical protein PL11201_310006 [Planktothrix sp. PCC 11201]
MNSRVVDKNIFRAILGGNETKAFGVVEPFDPTFRFSHVLTSREIKLTSNHYSIRV